MKTLAMRLAIAIHAAGGTPYFTGGCVRDLLIGRASDDIDIEVFGIDRATLETILFEHCSKVDFVGAQYGIYKADGLDVGFPRIDKGHGKGAEVEVDINMPIEIAAKRRDLTINALYLNPFTLQIEDPFNGRFSIANRVIRHVSDDTFHKDPLRPVRAARFCATLGFDIDYNTILLCRRADPEKIKGLHKDRVFGELKKVLLYAPSISRFFHALENMWLMECIFPELHRCSFVDQGQYYHPEGSVLAHTLLALDEIPIAERKLDVMLALLFHDLGKLLVPNVREGDKVHFKGHAECLGNATLALSKLTEEEALVKSVLNLIYHHMRFYDFKVGSVGRKQVRKLASQVDIRKLMQVHLADRRGRGEPARSKYEPENVERSTEIMRVFEEIENEIHPIIKGRHLIDAGFIPGDHFGVILRELFDRQLDEQFDSIEGGVKMAHTLFGSMKKKDK